MDPDCALLVYRPGQRVAKLTHDFTFRFSQVVLEARRLQVWPGSTLNVMASTANVFRNRLVRPVVSMTLNCAPRRRGFGRATDGVGCGEVSPWCSFAALLASGEAIIVIRIC